LQDLIVRKSGTGCLAGRGSEGFKARGSNKAKETRNPKTLKKEKEGRKEE